MDLCCSGLISREIPALLEAAYDDAAGVSAAFARNLLIRLNRDLQGDIDPSGSLPGSMAERSNRIEWRW